MALKVTRTKRIKASGDHAVIDFEFQYTTLGESGSDQLQICETDFKRHKKQLENGRDYNEGCLIITKKTIKSILKQLEEQDAGK